MHPQQHKQRRRTRKERGTEIERERRERRERERRERNLYKSGCSVLLDFSNLSLSSWSWSSLTSLLCLPVCLSVCLSTPLCIYTPVYMHIKYMSVYAPSIYPAVQRAHWLQRGLWFYWLRQERRKVDLQGYAAAAVPSSQWESESCDSHLLFSKKYRWARWRGKGVFLKDFHIYI